MSETKEQTQFEKLKAPFPVEALHWRLGQTNKAKTKAMMLVYIDARDVMDRLDEVFGLDWTDDYKEVKGRIVCTITVNGVSRSDGAGDTDFEAEKGGLSDAFKRAAVKWGVGRYLYDARKYNTWVAYSEDKKFSLYEDNKEQLDKVARLLSGWEMTPAEKAKATREANKIKAEELKEKGKKTLEWLKTLKRDLTAEENSKTEWLLKELSGTNDAESEAIGNEIAKLLMDKDSIGF
jgi:hypothetical protein